MSDLERITFLEGHAERTGQQLAKTIDALNKAVQGLANQFTLIQQQQQQIDVLTLALNEIALTPAAEGVGR